ncbi:type II toxin-antitoxin system YoeB family toxin [Rhodoferax sp. 4810]|uniref:Type II toxin-antitoxin system YoeB family toxin n=1 Tax=Thiospirillum jenense TaxID=1653858 RepID=A0A839HI78_9GAMM|nr:type II toxin-antitoxin system YoeB family toxin [Rhodoferax jenense]MBB1126449.1 type II toxin-antitoxin system YoeB family toxin [Thiospirillum jenense]
MKRIVFEQEAFADFTNWSTQDKKVYKRIVTLITDVLRQPIHFS